MFKRLSALVCFAAAALYGQASQVAPDCVITFTFTAPAQATPNLTCGHNNTVGIYDWHVLYFSTGFSALSLVVESAPDAGGVPGTWVTFAGMVDNGVNPNTATTQADTRLHGYFPWNRVRLATATGTGLVQGVFYGCRQPGCSNTQVASAVATAVNLTQIGGNAVITGGVNGSLGVGGLAANGAPPAGRPVLVAGSDGVDVRDLNTDNTGKLNVNVQGSVPVTGVCPNPCPVIQSTPANLQAQVTGAAAAGTPAAGNPLLQGLSDGTNAQNAFFCPSQAVVTITAGTDVVLVAGVAAKNIIVCHLDFVSDTVATFTIRQGTGTTCGTNTATLAGAYPSILSFAADYGALGALRTTIAARDLCLHSGASATVGGVVTYAQF